ncbi:MAG: ATP-binding protein, partial [Actinomycetota bacterium]
RQVEERLCAALNHERVATDRLAVALERERAALERERAAAEHLRTLDELKSGFLQAVSHDLRTPLASVLGISLTLRRGRGRLGPADTDDLLGRLIANARKLDRILTSLLDLDKLDRGIVELRRERVDLDRLVAGVVSEARDELLGTHPVSLELLPVQVVADAAKVERIVENLLANAARYTDPGTPIWVRVSQRDRGALLCVDDAGPGIPAEQRESIFRPFQRGPAGATYAPGSGVGLAVVAQIASLHDGQAWVEDRAGGGASFRVLLPAGSGGGYPPAGSRPGDRAGLTGVLSYLSRLVGVVRTVSGNPGLLRVELAFVGFNVAEWATWVSILAFAYGVGGAAATGLVALVQLVPAALVAPLAAIAGDRYRRERVLLTGYVVQALSMAATATALLAEAPVPLVYGLAALSATSITITRPAQNALLPSLARTTDELTAANVASSWTESVSVLGGPALAAVLLGVSGPGAVFAVMAAALACSG